MLCVFGVSSSLVQGPCQFSLYQYNNVHSSRRTCEVSLKLCCIDKCGNFPRSTMLLISRFRDSCIRARWQLLKPEVVNVTSEQTSLTLTFKYVNMRIVTQEAFQIKSYKAGALSHCRLQMSWVFIQTHLRWLSISRVIWNLLRLWAQGGGCVRRELSWH